MGSACSGHAKENPVEAIDLDDATILQLRHEFDEVDVYQAGWIDRQQLEAILLKRAYEQRTTHSSEYQIGGAFDKTHAYKMKDVSADRNLVQVSSLSAFSQAERLDFAGFVKWQQSVTRRPSAPSRPASSASEAEEQADSTTRLPLGRAGTNLSLRQRSELRTSLEQHLRRAATAEGTLERRTSSAEGSAHSHTHSRTGSQRSFRAGKPPPLRPRQSKIDAQPAVPAERPLKALLPAVPDVASADEGRATAPGRDMCQDAEARGAGSGALEV